MYLGLRCLVDDFLLFEELSDQYDSSNVHDHREGSWSRVDIQSEGTNMESFGSQRGEQELKSQKVRSSKVQIDQPGPHMEPTAMPPVTQEIALDRSLIVEAEAT